LRFVKNVVVPSILRQFSAPIKLVLASGEDDGESLAFLAARDTDGFDKWEAGQELFTLLISFKSSTAKNRKKLWHRYKGGIWTNIGR
jgi:hypothetical protein